VAFATVNCLSLNPTKLKEVETSWEFNEYGSSLVPSHGKDIGRLSTAMPENEVWLLHK
jgi:hypothetical protein